MPAEFRLRNGLNSAREIVLLFAQHSARGCLDAELFINDKQCCGDHP
jgi:hypothetical protein